MILAASLVLAILLVSGSLWLAVQTANRRHAVEADLQEVEWLQESARRPEARAALKRAAALLEGGGPHDLNRRVGRARSDLDLVMLLDTIRLKRMTRGELAFYKWQASRDYEEAFQQAGLGTIDDQPVRVAVLINGSAVREALLAAVYDWAVCAADKAQRGWLMDVARLTNPSSDSWHQRVLDRTAWDDPTALAELARTVPANQSVSLLLALGERLRTTGADAAPFLKRIQKEHPADFWANMILSNAIRQGAPGEAAGYYRAALASRPAEAVGYCAVGDALRLLRWLDEAIDYYEKAIRVDPGYARAYSNLGLTFLSHGQVDEAIDRCRKALELDPDYAWAHQNLANALRVKGRLDEAFDHYQQVIRLDPKNTMVANGIRSLLMRQGRSQELQVDWRKALDVDPPDYSVWQGYAELCLFLEQPEEYCRTRRALLDRFGATGDPYIAEPVGRACMLLPAAGDELRRATLLTDRAVAAKASTPEWTYR
jgi:serine/threonine-protein kinase